MNNRLNKYKYPGAKRLMLEAQELKDNTEDYCAQPIDDNLFEWHFTVRGPPDTAFDGGFYHGRLSFPTEYPMKPPSIILLTPNGRFETNKKICLSISGYHPETWQPSWSVRTALLALIAFMPTKANRAIGSLDFSDAERRRLAIRSRTWRCESCGLIKDLLRHPSSIASSSNETNSNNHCKPGTSGINEVGPSQGGEKYERKSSSTDRSDSDEDRDSPSDSQKTTSFSNIVNNDTTNQKQQQKDLGLQSEHIGNKCLTKRAGHGSDTHSSASSNGDYSQSTTRPTDGSVQNLAADGRRTNSSFVFRSIFILLSLLILRRVVMVMQA